MINKDFFPTPVDVIIQMISPVRDRVHRSTILEPSAGKGDILDYLVKNHRVHKDNVYAIEIESEFFKIRIYKKGTVHMTFKDKALHAKFNQTAADGKNWVGAGY